MPKNIIVCDLETTGLDPATDRIIEVGLVRVEQGNITAEYHALVNPGMQLPLKIKRLTGLGDGDLAQAHPLPGVLPEILDFIGESAIAGHNVRFDLGFLTAACGQPFQNPLYDTLELARLLAPEAPSYRLESLCSRYNIEISSAHRALDDAMATAKLLQKLINNLREFDVSIVMQLERLLREACSGWHSLMSDMIKESLKSFPDRKLTSVKYWHRVEEKDNTIRKNRREQPAEKENMPLEEVAADLLRKCGPLAALLPSYEYRPQQEKMVRQVARALSDESYLLMEAGTGVGKSMAYLIPAVLWSLKHNERVLVATHTINLQEQLLFNDIPLLTGLIKEPFRSALAKGRQNYICLRRWFGALESHHLPEEAAFLARVLIWLTVTGTGDRNGLNMNQGENDYWYAVCAETDGCLGSRCRYQRECFVNKAKKAADEADLVITNHSLLFSDVRADNRVLPTYGPLIIDEAHHLEESATIHLGRQFSQGAFNRWIGSTGKNLARLSEKPSPESGSKWSQTIKIALETRLESMESMRHFFKKLWDMAAENRPVNESEYSRISMRMPFGGESYWQLVEVGRECAGLLRKFTKEIRAAADLMDLWSLKDEAWAGPSRDICQLIQSGEVMIEEMEFIIDCGDHSFVYWTELESSPWGPAGKSCSLIAAPIDVGQLLFERFLKNKRTVIFTSATLTVNQNFDHFTERTGLHYIPEERLVQAQFESPFLYDRQALLCINRGLPVQGAVDNEEYLNKLGDVLYKLVQVTEGRTLVLFTSHRTLREIYWRLKHRLEELDVCLLGHGIDGSRSRLLEEFKKNGRSVLFGASSFWEGVDVPGEALTFVVMVKLPFMSPSMPVLEARLEDLARRERDGFRVLSVPQAVIRFKQGFGRLIRNSSDRGCVIILDSRILDKSYGRQFLRSLPVKSHFRGGIEMITKKISDWIGDNLNKEPASVNTWKEINVKKIAHLDRN